MEGIGSRTGRPSSRYGSTPVFTGPVRRWQKQWVHVSSSVSYNNNRSKSNTTNNNSNNNNSNDNDISAVRIRRWTPVPSVQSGDGETEEERPKRKIRYAPIVVLEGRKKDAEKSDVDAKETSKTGQSAAQETSENDDDEIKNNDNVLAAEAQAPEKSAPATKDLNNQPMDLDIGDDDEDDEDHDLGGTGKAADWVTAAQKGFAC